MFQRGGDKFSLVVHATHEAGIKVGGIGATLEGLLSTDDYQVGVERSILVGPMNTQEDAEMELLVGARNKLQVEYSSYHGLDRLDPRLSAALGKIEASFNVHILYGKRELGGARYEVLLIDASDVVLDKLNLFKRHLYDRFGIQSDWYEGNPEYGYYVHAAEPSYLALKTLVGPHLEGAKFIVAHDFMGLPLAFSAMIRDPGLYHTVFYAHEVATVRSIVENSFGHDVMFYNTMRRARAQGLFLEQVFGDQAGFFKHALIRSAIDCDNILAVGDCVLEELRFLSPAFAQAPIDLVYNGVPSHEVNLEDKLASKAKLAQYAVNLGLFEEPPDLVLTHVSRLVPSKALWRDVRVLEWLDSLLKLLKKRAVMYVLATAVPAGRRSADVHRWEQEYGWPVVHRQTNGDLRHGEVDFYRTVESFNQQADMIRVVLVNQLGWSQDRCGTRMPSDMDWLDLHQGSDVAFGQSIYEPFGNAQLEPLSFGTLAVVSDVCGCLGFVRRAAQGEVPPSIIVADYTRLPSGLGEGGYQSTQVIGRVERDLVELSNARQVADEIVARLPTTKRGRQRLLRTGYQLSQAMSWQVVVRDYFLPGLANALSNRHQV